MLGTTFATSTGLPLRDALRTNWSAQINGWRGEIDTDDKIKFRTAYDLYYIENWSLWFDLKILFLTPLRLFNTENAY